MTIIIDNEYLVDAQQHDNLARAYLGKMRKAATLQEFDAHLSRSLIHYTKMLEYCREYAIHVLELEGDHS